MTNHTDEGDDSTVGTTSTSDSLILRDEQLVQLCKDDLAEKWDSGNSDEEGDGYRLTSDLHDPAVESAQN